MLGWQLKNPTNRGKGASKFRYATPTKDTRLNASGNMTRNNINKILAGVTQKGGKFFIPKSNHPLALRGGDGVRVQSTVRMGTITREPSWTPRWTLMRRQ